MITGESIPVDITTGDRVSAGAVSSAGVLEIEAATTGTGVSAQAPKPDAPSRISA